MRMRTINEASAYLLDHDPQTALTKTAIRRLVVTGVIPSVRVGNKYLIALENLEQYLGGGLPVVVDNEQKTGTIRRVEV